MTQPSNRRFVMEDRLPLESADLAAGSVTEEKIADSAVTSAKIANGTIVDADVNASAAIAATKVQGTLPTGGTTGQILSKIDGTNYNTTWIDNFAPNVELYAKNQSGSAMTKGQVVYIVGVDNAGDTPRLALADADTEPTSSKTIGRLKQDLADGEFGYVVTEGILEGLNTSAATAGQSIWLSSTAGGVVYGAPPAKPAHSVYLGVVIRAQSSNGKVYVKVQNGFELEELHNVNINSGTLATGQALTYDGSSSMWVNSTPASTLNDLTDVTINAGTLAGGQVIKYDSGTTQWVNGAAAGGVTASDTAPNLATSAAGDAWFDTNDGTLYVCYVDVDSTKQWVQVKANSALEATILGRLSALEGQAVAFGNLSPNYIINGGFDINQRGLTSTTTNGFGFDRWHNVSSGGTVTMSSQAASPGAYPTNGYNAANYIRLATSGQSGVNDFSILRQRIEDVQTLAGQTVTISFWARAATGNPYIAIELEQNGLSSNVTGIIAQKVAITTSWARYSVTGTIPALASGVTLSAGHNLLLSLWVSAGTGWASRTSSLPIQNATIDIWGVQLERGSQATAFRRNAPSIQAELAACQRYYIRISPGTTYGGFGHGNQFNSTTVYGNVQLPVPLRTIATSVEWSGIGVGLQGINSYAVSVATLTAGEQSPYRPTLTLTTATNSFSGGQYCNINSNANANAYIGFSAEL